MNLYQKFDKTAESFAEKTALVINGRDYSYYDLKKEANKLANILINESNQNVGIYCHRSLTTYTAILGSLQAGKTYVPLSRKSPAERNARILDLSECHTLIIDNTCSFEDTIFDKLQSGVTLIFPETSSFLIPEKVKKKFRLFTHENLQQAKRAVLKVRKGDFAYIIFTSGSTGQPKGVPISHKNLGTYITNILENYSLFPNDRFCQTAEISFDLSVHEIFLPWMVGASLYCVPEDVLMAPAKFIRDNEITIWTSVPSIISLMDKFKMLKKAGFPSLRFSFFCGEPLLKSLAVAWQKAGENSIVVNLYGPTETTVAITHYQLPKEESQIQEKNGVVSIGTIFDSQKFCLFETDKEVMPSTREGELCLSGSQVFQGYYKDLKNDELYFMRRDEDPEDLYYKTGDLVKQEGNYLFFLNRKDLQVKIRGYRIELNEINHCATRYLKHDRVCTITYSNNADTSIYLFFEDTSAGNEKKVEHFLQNYLPPYMIPKKCIFLRNLPLNLNGKIDRQKLTQIVENYEKDERS